jgi:hypothetical protein
MITFWKMRQVLNLLAEIKRDNLNQRTVLLLFNLEVNSQVALVAGWDTDEIAKIVATLVDQDPPRPVRSARQSGFGGGLRRNLRIASSIQGNCPIIITFPWGDRVRSGTQASMGAFRPLPPSEQQHGNSNGKLRVWDKRSATRSQRLRQRPTPYRH